MRYAIDLINYYINYYLSIYLFIYRLGKGNTEVHTTLAHKIYITIVNR